MGCQGVIEDFDQSRFIDPVGEGAFAVYENDRNLLSEFRVKILRFDVDLLKLKGNVLPDPEEGLPGHEAEVAILLSV